MNRKTTVILLLMLGFAITIFISGIYVFKKSKHNLSNVNSDFKMDSKTLLDEFVNDELKANATYTNKIIEVTGNVKSVVFNETSVFIIIGDSNEFSGINCSFDSSIRTKINIQSGDIVTVKGECTGFLDDVLLSKCLLVQ